MTIGDRTALRAVCLLLVLLLSLLLISSCGPAEHDFLPVGEATTTTAPWVKPIYRIRYPQNASASLVEAVDRLAAAIARQTDCAVYVMSDEQEDWTWEQEPRDVLVGLTEHPLSQFFLSDLNRDDYLCHGQEGTVVLGGVCDESTVQAIEYFLARCVPFATQAILVGDGTVFVYDAEYPCEDLLLNSHRVREYALIYPADNLLREYELAQALRQRIADLCGAYLPLYSDEEAERDTLAIQVGDCFDGETVAEPGTAYQSLDGLQIRLSASDSYGLSCAVENLCSVLESSVRNGSFEVTLQGTAGIPYHRPSLRLLTASTAWKEGYTVANCIAVTQQLCREEADLCLLGEMDLAVWETLRHNVPAPWTAHTVRLSEERLLPILVRSDALTLNGTLALRTEGDLSWLEIPLLTAPDGTELTVLYLPTSREEDTARLQSVVTQAYERDRACVLVTEANGTASAFSWAQELLLNVNGREGTLFDEPRAVAVCADPSLWEVGPMESLSYVGRSVELMGGFLTLESAFFRS